MYYPYSPMHPSRKTVSVEEMQETLQKRCHEAAQRQQTTVETTDYSEPEPEQSRPSEPTAAELVWKKPVRNPDGTGYQETQCRLYTVAKAFVNGIPKYTAHRRAPEWTFVLGCRDCAEGAKALCAEHWKVVKR